MPYHWRCWNLHWKSPSGFCPLEFLFVDKYSNGFGCIKVFCHGPEIVDGVSVTLKAALDILKTEALPINDLAV
jgi:hypothetical protein